MISTSLGLGDDGWDSVLLHAPLGLSLNYHRLTAQRQSAVWGGRGGGKLKQLSPLSSRWPIWQLMSFILLLLASKSPYKKSAILPKYIFASDHLSCLPISHLPTTLPAPKRRIRDTHTRAHTCTHTCFRVRKEYYHNVSYKCLSFLSKL